VFTLGKRLISLAQCRGEKRNPVFFATGNLQRKQVNKVLSEATRRLFW